MSGARARRLPWATAALLAASIGVSGVGVELAARWARQAEPRYVTADAALVREIGAAHATAAPGVDPRWFAATPPPLESRIAGLRDVEEGAPVSFARRFARGVNWPKALDGAAFAASVCRGGGAAEDVAWIFAPEADDSRPYRFLPNARYATGLVTNRHGWRSPDIALAKPAGTLRIAMLGASTTLDHPRARAAYPEFVAHWLGLWARAKGIAVEFEIMNLGREGLRSPHIEAVFRHEAAPFAPDIVVYYEGSNQFLPEPLLVLPPGERFGGPFLDRLTRVADEPPFWRRAIASSAALSLAAQAWSASRGLELAAEPPKPDYAIAWPEGVDERDPNPRDPRLPLNLPAIFADLDRIARVSRDIGADLAVASFVWLGQAGLSLPKGSDDPLLGETFGGNYGYLNEKIWPLRYADLRRLADFQNRAFAAYARDAGVDFIDVAAGFPADHRLFFDPIHTNEEGSRLRAWRTFLGLIPIVERRLAAGARARAASAPAWYGTDWAKPADPAAIDCRPAAMRERSRVALDLNALELAYARARLESGASPRVTTAPEPTAYAAWIDLARVSAAVPGVAFEIEIALRADARIAVGLLSADKSRFLAVASARAEPGRETSVRLNLAAPPDTAPGFLVFANDQPVEGRASEFRVLSVGVYAP